MGCNIHIPTIVKDWTYTILIGALVTTYWRGTWVLLDIWFCQQPPDASLVGGDSFCFMVQAFEDMPDGYYWNLRLRSARITYLIGLALLFVGVVILWSGAWVPRLTIMPDGSTISAGEVTPSLAIVRFLIVYILGASAVCLWRGIWYWADAWILPDNPVASYWTTSLVGSSTAFLFGAGASILAPPAIFLLDGPGKNPPPIAVTVVSSYYSLTLPYNERPPQLPLIARIADIVGSFVFLPFAVVWFWRGTWLLLDNYLWGFSLEREDVHYSKLWGTIFSVICIVITCEPIVAFVDSKIKNPHILGLFGRLRTYILAWGTVSLWRVAWYVWDEFLGGTTTTSAWVSHVVSLVCLTALGCASCIMAPASTMGVDAVPNENCADEPLFSMLPIPYELIYFCGIARQESARKKEEVEKKTERDETTAPEDDSEKTKRLEEIEMRKKLGKSSMEADFLEFTTKRDRNSDMDEFMESEEQPHKADESAQSIDQAQHETTASGKFKIGSFMRETFLRSGPKGSRVSYFEMQRPQLHSRSVNSIVQRPSEDNRRSRSQLYRSR